MGGVREETDCICPFRQLHWERKERDRVKAGVKLGNSGRVFLDEK